MIQLGRYHAAYSGRILISKLVHENGNNKQQKGVSVLRSNCHILESSIMLVKKHINYLYSLMVSFQHWRVMGGDDRSYGFTHMIFNCTCPLVNQKNERSRCLSSVDQQSKWPMFNSYVRSPEGKSVNPMMILVETYIKSYAKPLI